MQPKMTEFNVPPHTTSTNQDQLQRPAAPTNAQVVTPSPESPLFTDEGIVSPKLQQFLLSLPAPDPETADTLSLDTYAKLLAGELNRNEFNTYLQETVFKKNAGKFSYELSGATPTEAQLKLLSELEFRGEVRVEPGTDFDTAIVWGGTLAAVESRISTLLEQNVNFARVVLLGTNKRELDKGEKTHGSETPQAMEAFLRRANERTGRNFIPASFPSTESEMMAFAWEALKPSALESLPAITIDTPGRTPDHLLAKYKHVPGTADTFGYLLLFARENGIVLGTRFIAASSQPHILRQTVDAEYKLLSVDYPFDLLAGIGRANEAASLTLYLQEVAKLVNTQHRIATSDVLHALHSDIVNAVSVLTVGVAKPGTAF
jgi:hypothetical protein